MTNKEATLRGGGFQTGGGPLILPPEAVPRKDRIREKNHTDADGEERVLQKRIQRAEQSILTLYRSKRAMRVCTKRAGCARRPQPDERKSARVREWSALFHATAPGQKPPAPSAEHLSSDREVGPWQHSICESSRSLFGCKRSPKQYAYQASSRLCARSCFWCPWQQTERSKRGNPSAKL